MKILQIFTDGSCVGNGKSWGYGGYGVHFPNKELDDFYKPFTSDHPATNQKTELRAIYSALKRVEKNKSSLKFDTICIFTDSDYSINCLTKWVHGWIKRNWINSSKKKVKNKEIIERIWRKFLSKDGAFYNRVEFTHVNSHTGGKDFNSVHNDIADRLANKGTAEAKMQKNKFNTTKVQIKSNSRRRYNKKNSSFKVRD